MPPSDDSARPPRLFGLLAALLLVRLVFVAAVPLVPDEAYYWEWSRRLAGGYFDHPPVIAWLIAGGTALLGDTPLGVRLLPNLAGTLATAALAWTADVLAGPRAARTAVLAFAAMPLVAVGMVLATPDAPLLMGIAWTLLAVVRAVGAPVGSAAGTRWWAVAGLAIGIAMASKFTGILVPMGLALTCLAYAPLRARFREPGPYLAVAIASLVMGPVLRWNAAHDWIAFRFQLGHGLGAGAKESLLTRELNLIAGQAGLATPILFALLLGAVFGPLRTARRAARRDAYTGDARRVALAGVAAFALAFFILSATRKNVEANWPAIAWAPAVVLLAAGGGSARSRWERRGLGLAAALSALMLVHVVHPLVPLPGGRDPVNQAYGWDGLAARVDTTRRTVEMATGWDAFVAANRYQDAAMLAFHLPGHPTVDALNLGGRPNQYALWPRVADRAAPGATLLLVLELPRDGGVPGPIRALTPHFVSVVPGDTIALRRADWTVARRQLWTLTGWAGTWPETP